MARAGHSVTLVMRSIRKHCQTRPTIIEAKARCKPSHRLLLTRHLRRAAAVMVPVLIRIAVFGEPPSSCSWLRCSRRAAHAVLLNGKNGTVIEERRP